VNPITLSHSVAADIATDSVIFESVLTSSGAELVVLNRFGKLEEAGRGLRAEIIAAVVAEIPLIIAVSEHRFDAWNRFVGGMSVKLACRRENVDRWWRSVRAVASPPLASASAAFCNDWK
jgi:hypothetical protein